ncbi:hypothetical protein PACTADRAFT_47604 [Pachysolen tannophilus NRRL Y-2460]|uniref:Ras-GEF domain-containing protein n=1 Tax=Pachysolen tannophilus NRRL Y-2460 TaxID=669874 RepID=A0A1E4U175_PACTA|nr:hypothetical protein PACTADRAFT_47604 [Pachysolen tannophilus NRRL Y-2460]
MLSALKKNDNSGENGEFTFEAKTPKLNTGDLETYPQESPAQSIDSMGLHQVRPLKIKEVNAAATAAAAANSNGNGDGGISSGRPHFVDNNYKILPLNIKKKSSLSSLNLKGQQGHNRNVSSTKSESTIFSSSSNLGDFDLDVEEDELANTTVDTENLNDSNDISYQKHVSNMTFNTTTSSVYGNPFDSDSDGDDRGNANGIRMSNVKQFAIEEVDEADEVDNDKTPIVDKHGFEKYSSLQPLRPAPNPPVTATNTTTNDQNNHNKKQNKRLFLKNRLIQRLNRSSVVEPEDLTSMNNDQGQGLIGYDEYFTRQGSDVKLIQVNKVQQQNLNERKYDNDNDDNEQEEEEEELYHVYKPQPQVEPSKESDLNSTKFTEKINDYIVSSELIKDELITPPSTQEEGDFEEISKFNKEKQEQEQEQEHDQEQEQEQEKEQEQERKETPVSVPVHKTWLQQRTHTQQGNLKQNFSNISKRESQNYSSTSISTAKASQEHEIDKNDDLSVLFITATHPFNSSQLESTSDASICLSFTKDVVAFIHLVDKTGWGEVTLLDDNLNRGWIPMNYFKVTIDDPTKRPLKPLFKACGKFLLNPQDKPIYSSNSGELLGYSFQTSYINEVRDGVRELLEKTKCLSRHSIIVQKKSAIRKLRKQLLQDWYKLMERAKDYRNTVDLTKIEVLELYVYKVLKKSIIFLDIWNVEYPNIQNELFVGESQTKTVGFNKFKYDFNNIPLLSQPPDIRERLYEISNILVSYLCLIIGRMDLIEHNAMGYKLLEILTHHILLLWKELSNIGSKFLEILVKTEENLSHKKVLKNYMLDLEGLIRNFIKFEGDFIKNSEQESRNLIYNVPKRNDEEIYYYTETGAKLIDISSKMIAKSIHISSFLKFLLQKKVHNKNLELSSKRSYVDFTQLKIEPEEFIKKLTVGLINSKEFESRDHKIGSRSGGDSKNKRKRFSTLRSGKTGSLMLDEEGIEFYLEQLPNISTSSPLFNNDEIFKDFTDSGNANKDIKDNPYYRNNVSNEIMKDQDGHIIGTSFRGLIFLMTDELMSNSDRTSMNEELLISTFFINYKFFGSSEELLDCLIDRFDLSNTFLSNEQKSNSDNMYSSLESRFKSRRKLIVKILNIWLCSYWNYKNIEHFKILTTLLNFISEGVSNYLPLESVKLIETIAKIISSSSLPVENMNVKEPEKDVKQLVERDILVLGKNDTIDDDDNDNDRFSMISLSSSLNNDEKLGSLYITDSGSSSSNSIKSLLSNSSGSSNYGTSLSKSQLSNIETINLAYRQFLTTRHWKPHSSTSSFFESWSVLINERFKLPASLKPSHLLEFNEIEISKQLTIIESNIFRKIKIEELLDSNFAEKKLYLKLSPNINKSLAFTNALSEYVIETLLQENLTIKQRCEILKKWLQISQSLLCLNNFNSLASIVISLQNFLISRCSRIWSNLDQNHLKIFERLCKVIHPEKNYAIYRKILKKILAKKHKNIRFIPYLNLFLQDLTFVVEGNSNYRPSNTFLSQKLINIDKYFKITKIIGDLQFIQKYYAITEASAVPSSPKKNKKNSNILGARFSRTNFTPDNNYIYPVLPLQEMILLELWKVKQLKLNDDDRAWKLSCLIQPREK